MCSLIDSLSAFLQCTPFHLGDSLRDVNNLSRVNEYLASSVLVTTHLKNKNRVISFKGLTLKGPNKQHAYNGYLGVTVQQHMYCKHRLSLRYADVPCIEATTNNGHVSYYPIECLRLFKNYLHLAQDFAAEHYGYYGYYDNYGGSTVGALVNERQTNDHSWRKGGKGRTWKKTPAPTTSFDHAPTC